MQSVGDVFLTKLQLKNSFKWQNMAGVRAGAENMDKGGAGAENKQFWLNKTEKTVYSVKNKDVVHILIYRFYTLS